VVFLMEFCSQICNQVNTARLKVKYAEDLLMLHVEFCLSVKLDVLLIIGLSLCSMLSFTQVSCCVCRRLVKDAVKL